MMKNIDEIAEYIYVNPDKKRGDIVSFFVEKWHKSDRTVQRYLAKAQKKVENRIALEQKAKEKIIEQEAGNAVRKNILTRQKALEILTSIAEGSARKISDQLFVPTDRDRIIAIDKLSIMEGWNAASKTDINIRTGKPLTKEDIERIESELQNDY